MKHIYLLLFAFISINLSAQISTDPMTLDNTIPLVGEYVYHVKVKNSGNTDVSVHWLMTKGAEMPSSWRIYLCDINLCYGPGTLFNTPTKPNKIPANSEVEFTIHADPIEIAGSGKFSLQLFSDAAHQNLLWETDPNGVLTAGSPSSVSFESKDEISVYPNPADNFFSIKNNNGVAKVTLYNVVGREVKKFNGSSNYFDISDLTKGIYLVRATDNKGKILKTVRLSKR